MSRARTEELRQITMLLPKNCFLSCKDEAKSRGQTVSEFLRGIILDEQKRKNSQEDVSNNQRIMRLITQSSNSINSIARFIEKLEEKGELNYDKAMQYLIVLNNIELQQSLFLETFRNKQKIGLEQR